MAYGFYEQTLNGERVIEAAGNRQFHTRLALLPEHNVGIFVAYNSTGDGGDLAEYELVEAFLDRYYPEPPISAESPAEAASGDAERLAGSYRLARSNPNRVREDPDAPRLSDRDRQRGRQHNHQRRAVTGTSRRRGALGRAALGGGRAAIDPCGGGDRHRLPPGR